MSLSDQLLLVLVDGSLTFSSIRDIFKKVSSYDNRKVLWSTLERLSKSGFVKKTKTNGAIQFSLTALGKKNLPKEPAIITRPDRPWDKKWRLLFFDLSEKERKKKDILLSKIKKFGFKKLQSSVYITVHNAIGSVREIVDELKIDEKVHLMLVSDLGIKDQKKFASLTWQLKELNQQYDKFIKKNKNGYTGKEFSSEVLRFWLHKIRYEYLSILHNDPILPKELLPSDWEGYEAEKIFNQLENILETY